MANRCPLPGEDRSNRLYFDSAMPGGALYYARDALPLLPPKEGVEPWKAQFYTRHAEWALEGEDMPRQRAHIYYEQAERKRQYDVHDGGRVGSIYYGPDAAVIATSLRPPGAKPLGPANDN
jgi:hypothetical protein